MTTIRAMTNLLEMLHADIRERRWKRALLYASITRSFTRSALLRGRVAQFSCLERFLDSACNSGRFRAENRGRTESRLRRIIVINRPMLAKVRFHCRVVLERYRDAGGRVFDRVRDGSSLEWKASSFHKIDDRQRRAKLHKEELRNSRRVGLSLKRMHPGAA